MSGEFFKILKNVDVYGPQPMGKKDILVAGEKIASIGDSGAFDAVPEAKTYDLTGKKAVPGFIDSHAHLLGGGGEGGFQTRTPEAVLSMITVCGVTTVAGLLGTDGIARHVESLLAKAHGLEAEGLTTYIYTGAYQLPTPTITGSVIKDIMMIDKVIGPGEIAMSDHRSSQPTLDDYRRLAGEARVGGMLSGKAGVLNIHMGDSKKGLQYLFAIAEEGEIPRTQFIPTHINRNEHLFVEGIQWAKDGGFIDVTSGIAPGKTGTAVKPSHAVKRALDAGVPLKNILMSSDGMGSMPIFDEAGNTIGVGVGDQSSIFTEFRDMVLNEKIPLEQAICVITSNVAEALKISKRKGYIEGGKDADFVIIDEDFAIDQVWARGQLMVDKGVAIVKGTFEK